MNHPLPSLAALGLTLTVSAALGADVGFYTDSGPAGNQGAVVSTSGNTPVGIADISTFNFNSVKAVFLNEADNGGFSPELTLRLGDLEAYVFNGGHLIMHDRFVAFPEGAPSLHPFLFGHPEIQVQRDFSNPADIDRLPAGVTAFPSLTDTSLDGGNYSAHGFGYATSLPPGATAFLSRGGAPGEVVSFQYGYGLGSVYYSTIPLDFYLNGTGNADLDANMMTMAASVISNTVGGGTSSVPEPAGYAGIAGLSLVGFALWRRSRRS